MSMTFSSLRRMFMTLPAARRIATIRLGHAA
jgi:hypothetical protein